MKDSAKLRAVNTVCMWKLHPSDSMLFISYKPGKSEAGFVSHVEQSNFTVNFVNKAGPATRHAGKFGCWWERLPTSRERLWKSLQGLKMKFESRNKRSSKAESSHSCRLSLLLKRYYQKHSSVMDMDMELYSEVLFKRTVHQQNWVLDFKKLVWMDFIKCLTAASITVF